MNSLEEFKDSLKYSERLIKQSLMIEQSTNVDWVLLNALQASNLVLLVSTFQNFLERMIEVNIPRINNEINNIDLEKLPSIFILNDYITSFEIAKGGYNREDKKSDEEKILSIRDCAENICNNIFNPQAFINKRLPSPDNIKIIFKNIDKLEIFNIFRIRYFQKTNLPCSDSYIQDTMKSIISRRNVVAHNYIDKLNLSTKDLITYKNFILNLAEIIYEEYIMQIDYIIEQSKNIFD